MGNILQRTVTVPADPFDQLKFYAKFGQFPRSFIHQDVTSKRVWLVFITEETIKSLVLSHHEVKIGKSFYGISQYLQYYK